MPEERQAPHIQDADLEAEKLRLATEAIGDAYALSTVKTTFWAYERYRSQNHDTRWNAHDALYMAWLPPRVWDGTTTPRASLGMPITFGVVESAFPAIYRSIFNDDQWFQVAPQAGTSPQEAQEIQGHLQYAIDQPRPDGTGETEAEFELAIKQMLLHGNGGVKIVWDARSGHPRIEWRNLLDLYFDPGATISSVDACRSVIERQTLTIDEIEAMRDDPRMKIPEKAILVNMSRNLNYVFADRTKQYSEAMRGVAYSPNTDDWSAVPAERKIEVLIYYSKFRIIWVFNREWIAYNERNPYGFIPFAFAPCFPLPGRFYAMSYADVVENPQRYIEALYNARLDELALALRPPRVRKRSGILTPAQQRWDPGRIIEADDPKNDVQVLYPQGATQDIMGDIQYLKMMLEEIHGVNSINTGVPRPSNANRTATGVQSQSEAGDSRLWTIVKHIEDYMIIPAIYKMYKMIQVHTYPGQQLPASASNGQHFSAQAQSFQKPIDIVITASSKMLTRDRLSQMVPFLAQYLLNGPFVQGLQAMGQTVDFQVFAKMLQDATGTASLYPIFRPMNQQEVQHSQQPPPQAVMQQQQAQQEQQTRLQLMDKKTQGEIQKAQIMKQPDQGQQQMQQMQLVQLLAQMQADKQKAQLDQQKQQHDLIMDHLTHQQKMQAQRETHQQELFLKAAQGQQQMQMQQQQHQHDMALAQAQGAQQLAMSGAQSRQQLEQGLAAGKQKLAQSKAEGKQSLSQSAAAGQQKIQQSQALTDHKMQMEKHKATLQMKMAQVKARNTRNGAAGKTNKAA